MIHNMVGGGGGKNGATLTVNGDAGATVTVTKDGKTYSRTVSSDGIAVFKGLETGIWSLTMSKDGDVPVIDDIEIISDYSHFMTFFRSYISVTYPAGSTLTCTHTDGTVYTADTNTGSYTFVIKKPGTWTILSTNNIQSDSGSIEITESGQNESCTLKYFASYINVTAPSGSTLTCVNGSNSQVYTLGSEETKHTFTVFETGTYTITGMRGIETDSKTVEITADEQSKDIILQYFVAYIKVTVKGAPGSTALSCSNGNKAYNYTLSANGDYTFTVYNTGTWTITGRKNGQTKTGSANVTTNGAIYTVTLSHKLVLFNNGNDNASVTGGWRYEHYYATEQSFTINNNGINLYIYNNDGSGGIEASTNYGIFLNNYKTLNVKVSNISRGACYLGVSTNLNISASNNYTASNSGGAPGTYTIDISSISSSQYIKLKLISNHSQDASMTISEVWLE